MMQGHCMDTERHYAPDSKNVPPKGDGAYVMMGELVCTRLLARAGRFRAHGSGVFHLGFAKGK